MTNFADHIQGSSHDAVKRYRGQADRESSSMSAIVVSPRGCIVFDDTMDSFS
jgi:hypothetical protein